MCCCVCYSLQKVTETCGLAVVSQTDNKPRYGLLESGNMSHFIMTFDHDVGLSSHLSAVPRELTREVAAAIHCVRSRARRTFISRTSRVIRYSRIPLTPRPLALRFKPGLVPRRPNRAQPPVEMHILVTSDVRSVVVWMRCAEEHGAQLRRTRHAQPCKLQVQRRNNSNYTRAEDHQIPKSCAQLTSRRVSPTSSCASNIHTPQCSQHLPESG